MLDLDLCFRFSDDKTDFVENISGANEKTFTIDFEHLFRKLIARYFSEFIGLCF